MSEKKLTATAPATERIGRRGKTVTDTATVKEEGEEEVVVTATSSAVVESPKRRKVEAVESEPAPSAVSTPPQKTPPRNEKKDSAAAEARLRFRYGQSMACSEEEEEGDGYKSADQEACCFKMDSNLSQIDNASSPESEVCLGLLMKEMESKSTGCTRSISVAYEAPSSEEIEEFFLSAEKIQAQRFKEKYNYDTVNDMPLEGRLKWERVKP